MSGFSLFAQLSKGNSDPFRNPDVIWGTAGLALALLAGAFLVYVADRWRKKAAARDIDSSRELTEFRRMFEHGEITEEEYAKLREKVAERVKAPPPPPATVPILMNAKALSGVVPVAPTSLPVQDQPASPPDSEKPANPSSPA
jgi:hypothetical protein